VLDRLPVKAYELNFATSLYAKKIPGNTYRYLREMARVDLVVTRDGGIPLTWHAYPGDNA
jgi:hypothetical protein